MSEFQLYRFKTIDRQLTKDEQEEVRSWSSRAQVNSTSATFVYHYGDFRKNEEKAVEDYFDAMLYVSNFLNKIYRLSKRIEQVYKNAAKSAARDISLLQEGRGLGRGKELFVSLFARIWEYHGQRYIFLKLPYL